MLIEKIEEMPAVWIYKNYFDVGNFIEKFEEQAQQPWPYLDWKRSITGDGGDYGIQESEHRSSLEAPLSPLLQDEVVEDIKEISDSYKKIFLSIDQCIWDYRNSYDLFLRGADGMQLLKYENSAQYHAHHDHSSENQRVLSLVACFGEEFEGGELEFPYFNKTIKLEKNSLVLFPSNFPYTHIAHPVTSGIKYSMVMWFI
jgi:hypothetical protein